VGLFKGLSEGFAAIAGGMKSIADGMNSIIDSAMSSGRVYIRKTIHDDPFEDAFADLDEDFEKFDEAFNAVDEGFQKAFDALDAEINRIFDES
jgi:uncharacterized phage infection (PIP) family protein YhgE